MRLSTKMIDHLLWIHMAHGSEKPGERKIQVIGTPTFHSNRVTHDALLRRGLIEIDPTTKHVEITKLGYEVVARSL